MFAWLVLGLLFVVVLSLSFSLYAWLLERRQRAEADWAEATVPVSSEAKVMILGRLTPVIAAHSPVAAAKVSDLQQELREAGFYHRAALTEFQAIRALLVLLPLFGAGVLALLADRADIPNIAVVGVVLAILGFSVPRLYINYVARTRVQQIERGLPVAIDLLNLGLSGGQNIFAALESVGRETQRAFPVLAEELKIVREQAKLSNLTMALQQFADRINIPDVNNLAMVLAQSDRLGTDVSTSLLEYANNIRITIRHRAEAYANRINFWMLFPTILCLWIPAALVLIGPVYFELLKKRPDTREIFNNSGELLKKNSLAPVDQATTPMQ
jgi:tight adherence protein C